MPDEHTFNSGSRILEPLANAVGLTVDKFNLVTCLLLSLLVSHLYKRWCAPGTSNRDSRLLWPLVIGLAMALFLYGTAYKHVLAMYGVSYVLIHVTPINHVHRCVFIFTAGYLSWMHYYRWMYIQSMVVDISGPMMLAVQKLTCMAFSLHDGLEKIPKSEELSVLQRREALRRMPTALEYFSYALTYQTAFAGPLIFFVDYIAFIEGKNAVDKNWYDDKGNKMNTDDKNVDKDYLDCPPDILLYKVRLTVGASLIIILLGMYFKRDATLGGKLWDGPFIPWYWYTWVYLFIERTNYYFAWLMADLILSLSGFGFSGFGANGEQQWELSTNVRPIKVELALSWKDVIDHWNISTMHWLRRVAYDRAHLKIRTISTYLLSAWWHGFFIGYYLMFVSAAMATSASRRVLQPHLHQQPTPHRKYYFSGHIIFTGAITLLPLIFKQHRTAKSAAPAGSEPSSPNLRRVDQSSIALLAEEKLMTPVDESNVPFQFGLKSE